MSNVYFLVLVDDKCQCEKSTCLLAEDTKCIECPNGSLNGTVCILPPMPLTGKHEDGKFKKDSEVSFVVLFWLLLLFLLLLLLQCWLCCYCKKRGKPATLEGFEEKPLVEDNV